MYRPYENPFPGKVEVEIEEEENKVSDEVTPISEIPESQYADSVVEMIDANSSEGAWMSLLMDAEKELEELESQKRLLKNGVDIFNGQKIDGERMIGLQKEIEGKIELQYSIIQIAKNNMKSGLE